MVYNGVISPMIYHSSVGSCVACCDYPIKIVDQMFKTYLFFTPTFKYFLKTSLFHQPENLAKLRKDKFPVRMGMLFKLNPSA